MRALQKELRIISSSSIFQRSLGATGRIFGKIFQFHHLGLIFFMGRFSPGNSISPADARLFRLRFSSPVSLGVQGMCPRQPGHGARWHEVAHAASSSPSHVCGIRSDAAPPRPAPDIGNVGRLCVTGSLTNGKPFPQTCRVSFSSRHSRPPSFPSPPPGPASGGAPRMAEPRGTGDGCKPQETEPGGWARPRPRSQVDASRWAGRRGEAGGDQTPLSASPSSVRGVCPQGHGVAAGAPASSAASQPRRESRAHGGEHLLSVPLTGAFLESHSGISTTPHGPACSGGLTCSRVPWSSRPCGRPGSSLQEGAWAPSPLELRGCSTGGETEAPRKGVPQGHCTAGDSAGRPHQPLPSGASLHRPAGSLRAWL